MIAYHRARIVARQFPHGKYTAFALLLDERADEAWFKSGLIIVINGW